MIEIARVHRLRREAAANLAMHPYAAQWSVQLDVLRADAFSVPSWHADLLHTPVWPLHAGNGSDATRAVRLATPYASDARQWQPGFRALPAGGRGSIYQLFCLVVLGVVGEQIGSLVAFLELSSLSSFALPPTLASSSPRSTINDDFAVPSHSPFSQKQSFSSGTEPIVENIGI